MPKTNPSRNGAGVQWEAPDAVAYQATAQPGKLACVDLASGERLTYSELNRRIDQCAEWLVSCVDEEPGQRIAYLSRNSVDMLITHLACVRSGMVFVPLNWRLAVPELIWLLNDAAPSLLLFSADFDETSAALGAEIPSLRQIKAAEARAEQEAVPGRRVFAPRDADTPSTIIYTSGTSGRPKGALLTERNAFFTAFNFALEKRMDHTCVFLCDMPLFHVIGILTISRSTLLQGGTLLISPGFDPALTLARLSDPALGVTHYMCVPQMAQVLRSQPAFEQADLSRLVAFGTGGAPNPPALIRRFLAEGIPMVDGYGSSEGGTILGMPLGNLQRISAKAGSAGLPPAAVRVRLVDDNGNDVPDGEVGEIWVRGPNVSPGYWNQPPASGDFAGGWFRTGDAARRDADGFYYIVDRKKDMFISGGENVYPAEVEAAILEMDAVAEACVIGIPDDQWGEVGCAYIVPRSGIALADADVFAHCDTRLARYKIPKRVVITDELPRTASGKLQKHVLRAKYKEGQRVD
ncbi:AMP-binding protein [Microvirga sp. VF16]|uniref:AMP-binding protein n=1 Tax=Microvirga sp. VF16 TaxID=2807101 RepID=UPI00193E690B|nr:AMP-binding protein [Microvirga sp. VF16]QRM34063.1 AMP-binding protein [Microvirga sp. VF16]